MVKVNNGVYANITAAYLSGSTKNGFPVGDWLSLIKVGDRLTYAEEQNGVNFVRLEVTGDAIDNGSWFNIPVSFLEAGGQIGNNSAVIVYLIKATVTVPINDDRLLMVDTTIATIASQTSFTLTGGSADDDAYNNLSIVIEDAVTATQKAVGTVLDYVGATKTVTLKEALAFTISAVDKVYILAENSLKSTVTNRQLNVSAAGLADGDMLAISNDTLAADNSALQWNGTGLVGDNFPATQGQVGSLSSGAGGLSDIQDSFTNTAGGSETNDENDTETLNAVLHIIDDVAGTTDFYYEFDLGVNGKATAIKWNGYVQGNGDLGIGQLFNWGTGLFEDQQAVAGTPSTNVLEVDFPTPLKYTGSGANAGKVRFGFTSTDANAIATDRILCIFTSLSAEAAVFNDGVAQGGTNLSITLADTASNEDNFYRHARVLTTAGTGAGQEGIITSYDGTTKIAEVAEVWSTNPDNTTVYAVIPGAVHCATLAGSYEDASVWLDSVNGFTGVVPEVNGVSTKPCISITEARTIADNRNLRRFRFNVGSTFVLDQAYDNWIFGNSGEFLMLNGQSISRSNFERCGITGIGVGTARTTFNECGMVSPVQTHASTFLNCGLVGNNADFVFGERGHYIFSHCTQGDKFTSILDFNGDNITSTTATITDFHGEMEIKGMTATDILVFTGVGKLTFNANCVGGLVLVAGNIERINNGSVTINEIARYDIERIVSNGAITTLSGAVVNVDVVDVTVVNSDMVAEPDNAGITANGVAIAALKDFDPASDTVVNVGTVATLTGHTAQTGDNYTRLGAPAGASVSADNAAIKADTALIDSLAIKKNTAFSDFAFLMVLTSDHVTPATGLTVTGQRSINGGAFGAVSGVIAEISAGMYQFDALAADTNGDVITWRFSSATADDTFISFKTVA